MMGLQAAIKSTTKRKYEIETDCEAEKKEEASPPKTFKFSDLTSKVLSPINNKSNTNNNNNTMTTTVVVKSIKSDIIPPETHHQWGSNEPIVDSISKLQAVTETWSNSTLSSTIPFNCTSSTLTSLAQTAENITRSTLATTLLDQDDLSEDEDDFQDDFDFDDEDDDDLLLDDHTVITTNHNYTPIRYPSSPSPTRQNYIPAPAYPKPGYAPENYQNCSRTPIAAQQYSQQQAPPQPQPHLRPSFFHGTNNNSSWNYYNHHHHHHPHHYDIGSHQQQPQTIRCAENGKSYFELGNSNYCGPNRICGNNGIGMMKNCCEGRNNLWCTAKQCYKEKRLKMMNLSMFKLARFRQASDQSLYRSVLICNTLKSLEKEIELENQTYHQRMQQQHRQALQQQSNMEFLQSFSSRQQQQQQPNSSESNKQQQQQNSGSNNLNNESSSMINCNNNSNNSNNNSNLSTCNNTSFSQPYTNNCIINRIPSFNEPMPIYEHHPLKDPSSGRATPFPSSPGISQLVSSSNSSSSSDADSAFGDIDDVDSSSTRSIDWGSVLINSQSALDPLSNNDIFSSSTTTSLTQTSSTITNLHVTISNGGGGTNNSNINNNTNSSSNNSNTSTVSSYTTSSSSSTPISSIITTLTTVSSCSLESLTASSISVSQNVSNSNWDFPYIDTESSNNSDYYELNCYKLSSALNQMDDFVKSDQLMTTSVSSVSPSSTNELEQLGTHIMVGS